MSKKNTKSKKFSPYRKYGFDRNMANAWNYESYRYWLICDEGREKPPSQRETNFFFNLKKYAPLFEKLFLIFQKIILN